MTSSKSQENSRTSETWKVPPTLAAYLERIGAEVRNFRRFVIKREGKDHYHYDAVIFRINDGKLKCPDGDYEKPTDMEMEAINKESAAHQYPKSIAARDTYELRKLLKQDGYDKPELFEFRAQYANDDEGIRYVQQRVRKQDGGKSDLPWSFWSDGVWRMMEPDGDLPLYGLDQLKNASMIYIHEGAKCAAAMTKEFLKDHPWKDDLFGPGIVHFGWPGGAPNPHRVDWDPIRNLPRHVRVVIVCDNDISGENAASEISRIIQRSCAAIVFTEMFPPHFDLADSFPEKFWNEKKEYRGPSYQDCWVPATWATRRVGKHYELREEFINEWMYAVKPISFVHRNYVDQIYTDKEFNAKCRPFSDVPDVAVLLKKSLRSQTETLVYEPGKKSGRIVMPGLGPVVNVYRPSTIKPEDDDVGPWFEFMEHLIPRKEDREHAYNWIATLIARPDVHMRYGMLLISEVQGVGKGTLGEKILARIIGEHNSSSPSESEIVDSNYNYWAVNKRLIVVHEIYAGHSAKAYNRLKSVITEDNITVSQKYLASYKIRNWLHVFACSNSMRALKLETTDRRWFVPEVTEQLKERAYWRGFNAWLNDKGLGIIAHWAIEHVKEHGIEDGEHPPETFRKKEVIRSGMSDGERFVAELGEQFASYHGPMVMRLDHMRTWLGNKKAAFNPKYTNDALLESPELISSVLRRSCGLKISKQQFKKDGFKFRIVANFEIAESGVEWEPMAPLCRPAGEIEGTSL